MCGLARLTGAEETDGCRNCVLVTVSSVCFGVISRRPAAVGWASKDRGDTVTL